MRLASRLLGASSALAQASLLQDLKNLAFPGTATNPTLDASKITAEPEPKPPAPVPDAVQGEQPSYPALEEMDLQCVNGTYVQNWFLIQQKMRYILGADAAFQSLDKQQTIEPALISILEDMAPMNNAADGSCGTGKVLVQLLSMLAVDSDGKAIGEAMKNEKLTSPMLTLLLDIPWLAVQPNWPMFGFFAQLQQRRILTNANSLALDGLESQDVQQLAAGFSQAIMDGNLEALKALSQAFLDAGPAGVQVSPIGFLTSVFTQVVTANSTEESIPIFWEAQSIVKKMVFSPADLDTLLSTRWPLWGMAYLASLKCAQ